MSDSHSTRQRAAVYYRMSTDKQEDSVGRQKSQVEPYALRHGYRVVAAYEDLGVAGDEVARRKDFCRMLDDARRGQFDLILCDDKDRFGRFDLIDQGELIAPLRRADVRLETVAQGKIDWNSFAGRITDAVLQEAKKLESQATSRRVLTKLVMKAQAGEWPYSLARYGYKIVTDGGRRVLAPGDPREVEVVRWVFDAVANRHWTCRQVQDELNARGVPPPKGNGWGRTKLLGTWRRETVANILHDRVYAGDLVSNKNRQGKYTELENGNVVGSDLAHPRPRRSRPQDWIVVENAVAPLIDRETFARAQEALARNRRMTSPRGGRGAPYVLSGLLVCGRCGAFMHGREDKGARTYCCGAAVKFGAGVCPHARAREDVVLPRVLLELQNQFLNPDRLAEVRAELLRQEEAALSRGGEADGLRKRVAKLARDIDRGNGNLAILPPDRVPGVVAKVRQWEEERDRLAAELGRIDSGRRRQDVEQAVRDAEAQLWKLREALASEDPGEVRAMLLDLVLKVLVHFEPRREGKPTVRRLRRGVIELRTDGPQLSGLVRQI